MLLHGFGGDLNNWLFNAEPLSSERAVYALDLPGHGGSVKEARDLVDALRAFLDSQGIDRVHLAGHSMGGLVAGEFAAAEPERVLSLTLIAPAGLGTEITMDVHRRVRRRELAQAAQAGAAAAVRRPDAGQPRRWSTTS